MAAERGAPGTPWTPTAATSPISPASWPAQRGAADCRRRRHPRLSGAAGQRRPGGRDRGPAPRRDPPVFIGSSFSRAVAADDPTTQIDTPQAGPAPAQAAGRGGDRGADRRGPGQGRPGKPAPRRPAGAALRHGLRVSELVGLPLSALAPTGPTLTVRGKGGKERMVPIGGPARAALAAWLGVRPFFVIDAVAAALAVSLARRASGHLTRQRVAQLLKALAPRGRARRGAAVAACAAPRVRQPPGRQRRRSALGAGDAWSRRHRHDADLYPCADRAAGRRGRAPPSAGRGARPAGRRDPRSAKGDAA